MANKVINLGSERLVGVPVTVDGRTAYALGTVPIAGGSSDAASAAKTSVDSGIASVTLLAANTDRVGAMITNTDTNALYIDLSGGTASATSYSVSLATGETHQVPFGYTGAITGIWAADGTGVALVTEFS